MKYRRLINLYMCLVPSKPVFGLARFRAYAPGSTARLNNVVCNFFSKSTLKKLSGIPPECQTVWFLIRLDVMSGLVWVQTVCKGHQQTTLEGRASS